MTPIRGLVPATFTPLDDAGNLKLDAIPPMVEHHISHAAGGLYVCGSTGEGPLLTIDERKAVAAAYVEATAGRIPVVVQVGHESLREARALAVHAAEVGASAISAVPPTYFKPSDVSSLADCLAEITTAAPETPFYYYHIPALSGVALDMPAFLEHAVDRLPSLAGIKFSSPRLDELQACRRTLDGQFDILFGVDEMLLAGIASGATGAVGSTYNILAPLYHATMAAAAAGRRDEAEGLMADAVTLVRIMIGYGGLPAIKAAMALAGFDCGPCRLPLRTLEMNACTALEHDLRAAGFYDWIDSKVDSHDA